jgi:hypothetical protein
MHATIEELLEAVFSVRSSPRPYKGNLGVVGDEKRSLESETVKYVHESHGTRTREGWRGPAATVNDRPALSSEEPSTSTNPQLTVIKIWS